LTSGPRHEYADVTDLFRRLTALDERSVEYRRQRDVIIERCLPLANHIARRFNNRGEPFEDPRPGGTWRAGQRGESVDADNGADFLAFAVPTMMGEVRRHFRDHGWSVKVPRRLNQLNLQLKKSREELSHQLGRAPTASEIATHLKIDREEVVQAQIASSAYSTLSSDAPAGASDDEGRSVTNTFGDLDANLDKVLDIETVRPLLAALPERDQTVLRLRFFDNMTQTQIAERLGYHRCMCHACWLNLWPPCGNKFWRRNSCESPRDAPRAPAFDAAGAPAPIVCPRSTSVRLR
jgi:RNA polymerase sigma-B factor